MSLDPQNAKQKCHSVGLKLKKETVVDGTEIKCEIEKLKCDETTGKKVIA